MVCTRCGKSYENMNFCPECGMAAAMPVIPDTKPVTAPKSVIPNTAAQSRPAAERQIQAAAPTGEPESASNEIYKNIIAVMSAIIIVLAAVVFILFRERSRLSGELEEAIEGGKTYTSAQKGESSESAYIEAANQRAREVFTAAVEAAEEMETMGLPLSTGMICSSPDIGESVGASDNAEYVMYYIANAADTNTSGTEWFVVFNDGIPVAAYASEGVNSKYIGSYPTKAEGKCAMSFEEGRQNADRDLAGASVSANTLYGRAS